MKPTRRIAIITAGAWMLAGPSALAADKPVTVFAAASLKNALDEVGVAYAARTGGAARFSYAGSPAIARQIEQGAPADICISADSDWMDYLAGKGLIVPSSRRSLLTSRLALIAPADAKTSLKVARGMPLAKALGGGRLAVAGPDVPAGRYAKASLTSLGVWNSVSGKLAQAENVRAALQFVARGESPYGIVYDTDAKAEPRVKIVGLFPEASHPRIVYPAALVAGGRNPRAAAFLKFLSGPEARAVFRKHGFVVLARR
ncbi:MAG: molybdate ABC transporter substrate-binding protein [Phenylobacterium sp.]|uniref:molybdate ABC transporter substrate-binding protein n=1 Tax=Phenylobacterium sp. TaxID=1871053 RepID=UPI00271A7F78|nr:molybdate ABC transporter substrate-binding protein [Phenylobacterium sp.]MDO8913127.1 molybdate ABC transporter substrate-binding protein [Phenylobacterium sp.]MDP3102467.1 molybdate ABC transporter substrate-binding protein [Phenylobacterium sp.]HQT55657.1 molybdate ABC transporter substrate-binding protein [Phenylobacterium sp.]